MIWSIDFDDETGVGLGDANNYKSPESATIIPMAHTTVPGGQTFTLNSGAATDVPRLPNGGNQNLPQGSGRTKCEQCSFFHLITSTCCGTGGYVGNPVLIPAGIATPMAIPLPAGFTPPNHSRILTETLFLQINRCLRRPSYLREPYLPNRSSLDLERHYVRVKAMTRIRIHRTWFGYLPRSGKIPIRKCNAFSPALLFCRLIPRSPLLSIIHVSP